MKNIKLTSLQEQIIKSALELIKHDGLMLNDEKGKMKVVTPSMIKDLIKDIDVVNEEFPEAFIITSNGLIQDVVHNINGCVINVVNYNIHQIEDRANIKELTLPHQTAQNVHILSFGEQHYKPLLTKDLSSQIN